MNHHKKALLWTLSAVCALLSPSVAQRKADAVKSFRGSARLRTLKAQQKNMQASALYPTFRAQTPLLRFVNTRMRLDTRKDFAAWVKQNRADAANFSSPSVPFKYQVAPILIRLRPAKIVSIRVDNYSYSGGAHGMFSSLVNNYGVVSGQPKALSLGDFFRPQSPYHGLVETKIFARLSKNSNAAWVQNKSVKTLTNAQFNNFEVHSDGLKWIFNAYEMGPYASGQFDVNLSAAELGADFRREWLK